MGEQLRRDFEPSESHWTYERLKEAIVTACAKEPLEIGLIAYERLPQTMDIGKIGDRARQCLEASKIDRKERSIGIQFALVDKKIMIDRNPIVGTERSVLMKQPDAIGYLYLEQLGKLPFQRQVQIDRIVRRIQDGRDAIEGGKDLHKMLQGDTMDARMLREATPMMVGNIHSHPIPLPISHLDIASFLSDRHLRILVVGRSDGKIEAIVKTHETQTLEREDALAKSEEWFRMVSERVAKGIQSVGLNELESNDRAQLALGRSIAKKYKFGYYTGGGGELKRVE